MPHDVQQVRTKTTSWPWRNRGIPSACISTLARRPLVGVCGNSVHRSRCPHVRERLQHTVSERGPVQRHTSDQLHQFALGVGVPLNIVRIPRESCHPFHTKVATDSTQNLPLI